MHEILYRGKAINRREGVGYRTKYKNGDWVYGLVTRLYDERFPLLPAEMTNEDRISGIEVDHTSIGEYTGLTDKNGTRIFEGDIVAHPKYGNLAVVWNDGLFLLAKHDTFYERLDHYSSELAIIIGNIYDNPELVKK